MHIKFFIKTHTLKKKFKNCFGAKLHSFPFWTYECTRPKYDTAKCEEKLITKNKLTTAGQLRTAHSVCAYPVQTTTRSRRRSPDARCRWHHRTRCRFSTYLPLRSTPLIDIRRDVSVLPFVSGTPRAFCPRPERVPQPLASIFRLPVRSVSSSAQWVSTLHSCPKETVSRCLFCLAQPSWTVTDRRAYSADHWVFGFRKRVLELARRACFRF